MTHKTVTVLPRDDGQNFQESWMVHVNGKMESNHTTKQAAKNAAREYASDGDTLQIRRQDGTIQKTVTVQDATADDEAEQSKGPYPTSPRKYGEEAFEIGVDGFFK